ncbi:MAG TPA: hypothetical protein VHS58_18640 [Acetobacteraceae bacterium]|nr:hypothetical protein [Acetobacteraceae bacterium]
MEDAYVIGIRLALENGVSAGIAAIAADLGRLDLAIATTTENLQRLRTMAGVELPRPAPQRAAVASAADAEPDQVPDAPARVPAARVRDDAVSVARQVPARDAPVAPSQATPPREASVSKVPDTAPGAPAAAAPPVVRILTEASAAPARAAAPVNLDASRDDLRTQRAEAQPAPAPVVSIALPPQPPAAPVVIVERVAAVPSIFANRAADPVPVASVPPATGAVAPNTAAPPATGAVAPNTAAPPARAVAPQIIAPVQAAAPAAAYPATPAAPPARETGSGGPTSGDVYLDGARMGRWISDQLARDAARPASGVTGFDPRLGPAWPGTLQGE